MTFEETEIEVFQYLNENSDKYSFWAIQCTVLKIQAPGVWVPTILHLCGGFNTAVKVTAEQ